MRQPASPREAVATQPALSGAGLGLRPPHHDYVRREQPDAAWFELHPENFLSDGLVAEDLEEIGRSYPLSFHAVGMSLASADGVDAHHLARLSRLIERHRPKLVSDHLSWSAANGVHVPDLLPLPYTEEALWVVSHNVTRAQNALGRQILLENPSSYLRFKASSMSEPDFLAELVVRTGCGVLLDLNNIYVSAKNAGLAPEAELASFLHTIPHVAIGELHLAGHAVIAATDQPDLRIDTHGTQVCADVWRLYETAITAFGAKPTLIEWDTGIPAFDVLAAEAATAQRYLNRVSQQEMRHALAG